MRARTQAGLGLGCLLLVFGGLGLRPGYRDLGGPCNPFAADGHLIVDVDHAPNTRWQPFDPVACPPSHLMADVWTALNSDLDNGTLRRALPWMVGRTVIKVGDSIDREQLDRQWTRWSGLG